MLIGNRNFDVKNHTYIMGILNVTPDSFSDGGLHNTVDSALAHVERMIKEGADIIDVGGESTRPGFIEVTAAEEIERTAPVIEKIKSEFNIPVSIDTYKPETAAEAVKAGADLINDVKNITGWPAMLKLIADTGCVCCLTHNRDEYNYTDFKKDFYMDLQKICNAALEYGIPSDRIILDPGIGFAKTYEDNLYVLNHLDVMNSFGCSWLLGTSRKSVIGKTLDLPADERLEGTLATTALGVLNKASFVRVHDVLENKRFITMLEAIRNA